MIHIISRLGKKAGGDYYIGYSPERINPSNDRYTVQSIPKVVSGQTEKCKQKVLGLYASVFDKVVPVSSPKVAEMCKLFENIHQLTHSSSKIVHAPFEEVYPHGFEEIPNRRPGVPN